MGDRDVRDAAFVASRQRLIPYALLFAVALTLRLIGLSAQNIWYDEHWTLRVALTPLSQLLDLLIAEEGSKPPVYFALMHYWVKLGSSEFWLRLPSAIAGACDCVVAAAVGRQLFGTVGRRLGWLLALAPFHIYYSQEARPFALWGLFMTTALLFQLKFSAAAKGRLLVGYIISALLACHTFNYGLFLLLFSVVFAVLYRPPLPKRVRLHIALANALVLILSLPWTVRVIGAVAAHIGFIPLERGPVYAAAAYAVFSLGLGFSAGPSLEKLRGLGMTIFDQDPIGGAILILGFLLLCTLIASGLFALWKRQRVAFHFSATGLAVFLGAAALLNAMKPEVPLNARYVLPAILPLMVLILAGGGAVASAGRWRAWLSLAFVIFVGISLGNHYFNPAYARDDLRSAANFVAGLRPAPENVLICGPHLADVFNHYFRRRLPVEPVSAPPRAEAERALQPLHERLSGVTRFALVYSRADHGDRDGVLPAALRSRYRLAEHRHWTGVDVFVFESAAPESQR